MFEKFWLNKTLELLIINWKWSRTILHSNSYNWPAILKWSATTPSLYNLTGFHMNTSLLINYIEHLSTWLNINSKWEQHHRESLILSKDPVAFTEESLYCVSLPWCWLHLIAPDFVPFRAQSLQLGRENGHYILWEINGNLFLDLSSMCMRVKQCSLITASFWH